MFDHAEAGPRLHNNNGIGALHVHLCSKQHMDVM